ncbi:hypothetical protein ACHAXT_010722 [Thalassiosira profunda]
MVRQAPCLALGIVVWSLLSFLVPSFCLLSPSPRHRPPGRHPKLQLQVTSTDGPSGLRRRWRRRKKYSVVAPDDKEKQVDLEDSSQSTETEAKEASTSDYVHNGAEDVLNGEAAKSQCPIFSKTFPRYRIDTSGASKGESEQRRTRRVQRGVITKLVKSNSNEKEDRRSPLGGVGGLLQAVMGGTSNALSGAADKNARKSVESFYRDEVQQGVFRWASSANVKDLPFLDEDLLSAASFWRMTADVVSRPTAEQQQFYLALPETTPSVAQSLCDVLNWYASPLGEMRNLDAVLCYAMTDSSPSKDTPEAEGGEAVEDVAFEGINESSSMGDDSTTSVPGDAAPAGEGMPGEVVMSGELGEENGGEPEEGRKAEELGLGQLQRIQRINAQLGPAVHPSECAFRRIKPAPPPPRYPGPLLSGLAFNLARPNPLHNVGDESTLLPEMQSHCASKALATRQTLADLERQLADLQVKSTDDDMSVDDASGTAHEAMEIESDLQDDVPMTPTTAPLQNERDVGDYNKTLWGVKTETAKR